MTEAQPTGWRCFNPHSDRGGKAAVGLPGPAVIRRFCPGWENLPGQRCPGGSDPRTASLLLAFFTARKRLAVTGVLGPPNRAPACFSLSAWQTVKSATGATAPVAPLQHRRLRSEPAPVLRPHSRWAGGR
ncbi:hypothetical protein NDU88_004597 [Pleurodeles waltl]|uniref:Uncharacterized protein n=1 Tax=Pleurodeles waltl TaxID=8319 RepID=A0AAV7VJ86_PLEWA|nr:hypothetical protein NDU88_004597 [Pleurodeles waltl]